MLIYLASPYSPVGNFSEDTKRAMKEYRFHDVCEVAARLMEQGHEIFCPIAHSHPIEVHGMDDIKDGDFWLKQDFAILIHCDELWVLKLNGWNTSHGISEEVKFAKWHGIPVKYIEPNDYLNYEKEVVHGSSQVVNA